jgi:hypothetical protein
MCDIVGLPSVRCLAQVSGAGNREAAASVPAAALACDGLSSRNV